MARGVTRAEGERIGSIECKGAGVRMMAEGVVGGVSEAVERASGDSEGVLIRGGGEGCAGGVG